MPPHLPRPSLSGVLSCSTSSLRATAPTTIPASVTWSARRPSPSTISPFSTTSSAAHQPVPPESPKYIRVPQPRQSVEERTAPIRGHLPVPRDIFPKRDGRLKTRSTYLKMATQVSVTEKEGIPPKSENEARARIEAATRREAFKEGIAGLWERKQELVQKRTQRTRMVQHRNKKASMAPERPDEVLTHSTFGPTSLLDTGVVLDPLRFERAEEARARHVAITQRKAEARRDALTQLYVAAGDFIVDEHDLEEHINRVFAEPTEAAKLSPTRSIWDGPLGPITVAETKASMFTGQSGSDVKGSGYEKTESHKTTIRQKSVAEVLTGGRL